MKQELVGLVRECRHADRDCLLSSFAVRESGNAALAASASLAGTPEFGIVCGNMTRNNQMGLRYVQPHICKFLQQ